MKYTRFLFGTSLYLSCCLVLCACHKTDPELVKMDYEYYDLTPGRYVEYEVTEIIHDVDMAVPHDTFQYDLKTVIGDTFLDNQGRIAREFLRYKKLPGQTTWTLSDIWTTLIVDARAELVEENQRIIKLLFPPRSGKNWNPNSFNNDSEQDWYYASVHQPYQLNGYEFDSTLYVQQDDFFSMVDHRRKFEVYAKGIGLIHKHYRDLKIIGFDTTNIERGTELYYRYKGHGIE
jgi:hypothetical protein